MTDPHMTNPAAPATPAPVRPETVPAPVPAPRPTAGSGSLGALYDLSLPVSIELGRTRMTVRDILALGSGSVVELERMAGEPVDVLVGDRTFARGEVVVLGEQFGVRLTRILQPAIPSENGA